MGFLVGGALVLLRQHGPLGPGRIVLAVTATILALLVLGLGYRRARQVRLNQVVEGRGNVPSARSEVVLMGCATIAFASAIVAALFYSAALG